MSSTVLVAVTRQLKEKIPNWVKYPQNYEDYELHIEDILPIGVLRICSLTLWSQLRNRKSPIE